MKPLFLAVSLLLAPAAASAESVVFTKKASRVGDRLEQRVDAGMELQLRSRRGAEVFDTRESSTGRRQRRVVVATGLDGGVVNRATVSFSEASRLRDGRSAPEPVVGKTYRCERRGEELRVTTDDGAVPPLAEYTVVVRAMESLGRPNPLADFLHGRTVAVGERIELPPDVARRVMGLEDQFGAVERFALTLRGVDAGAARFEADVEATGAGSSQMRVLLGGTLAIDASTCRVVSTELSGPIGLIETRGSVGRTYQVDGTGRMRIAVRSEHRAAAWR